MPISVRGLKRLFFLLLIPFGFAIWYHAFGGKVYVVVNVTKWAAVENYVYDCGYDCIHNVTRYRPAEAYYMTSGLILFQPQCDVYVLEIIDTYGNETYRYVDPYIGPIPVAVYVRGHGWFYFVRSPWPYVELPSDVKIEDIVALAGLC